MFTLDRRKTVHDFLHLVDEVSRYARDFLLQRGVDRCEISKAASCTTISILWQLDKQNANLVHNN